VIDLKRIPEMMEIRPIPEGLSLGAALPCCEVYDNALVRKFYPALAHTAELIGGTPIQSRASIGGNLCNAAPSADSIPVLIALGAVARITNSGGHRDVAVEHFCTAPGKTILQPGEIVTSIRLPNPPAGFGAHYLRFIPRNEMDIAVVGVGASLTVREGAITAAKIALASVAPVPVLAAAAGAALVGQKPGAAAFAKAAEAAQAASSPISDMRGTAEYRRHLVGVLTRRALEAAAKEIA
jgi:carbon-monoxide dehydrogenase medium subunit